MKHVDFRKLNEDLIQIVERTIDPKFRDALKASADKQNTDLKNRIDRYKNAGDNGEWLDTAEKNLKGKKPADYIYKQLAKRRLEVDKATIEYIGSGKDLDAKTLRNKIKAKLPADKKYDENNKVFLIADTHSVPELSFYRKAEFEGSGFYAWEASYSDERFYLDQYMGDTTLKSDIAGRTLMAYLNNNDVPEWDFYLAFGPSSYAKRRERAFQNNDPYARKDLRKVDKYDLQFYDKSGYPIDKMKDELIQRLKEYKKSKGAYTTQADEIQNALNTLETKVKDFMSNSDIRDFDVRRSLKEIMDSFSYCCTETELFISAINDKTSTDEYVNKKYTDAKISINKLERLLEK